MINSQNLILNQLKVFFLDFSYNSSTYRAYNIATNIVEEITNIIFDENNSKEIDVEYSDDFEESKVKVPST